MGEYGKNTGEYAGEPRLNLKVVRAKCLDCSGESYDDVRWCQIPSCPLWPFRFGLGPAAVERKYPGFTDPAHVTGWT